MTLDEITDRVYNLETTVSSMHDDLQELHHDSKELAETMLEVQRNTKDIVELLAGGRVASRIFLWVVGLVAGLAVIKEYFSIK